MAGERGFKFLSSLLKEQPVKSLFVCVYVCVCVCVCVRARVCLCADVFFFYEGEKQDWKFHSRECSLN